MRKALVIGVLIVGAWWWRRGGDSQLPARVQAAVLVDGFAALVRPRDVHDSRRVVELDRDATHKHQMALRLDRDVRLVGTSAGIAVGWQDGKKLKLGILDADGNPERVSTWGRKVLRLCDGAASNEVRFGVGWLESDGRVWFVHAPLTRVADETVDATPASAEAVAKVSWCGIASAERNVALFWREGDRLMMNFCSAKSCSGMVPRVPIDKRDTLLAYGCVADACLFATRDPDGNAKLYRVDQRGRGIVKPLDNATADTAIAIVGAGTRAFAIAYHAKDGLAAVQRVTLDGALSNVRTFDDPEAPSLAWAADTLFVVLQSEQMFAIDMPR